MSAVLAFTVLRPRTTVYPPTFEEGYKVGDTPIRSRIQFTHEWRLSPPSEWSFGPNGFAGCGPYGQTLVDGWQYGPFSFAKVRERNSWPVAVERAAHAIAVRKLGVKEPVLDIYVADSPTLIWRVVASAPGGKRLEMDFTDSGKSISAKK